MPIEPDFQKKRKKVGKEEGVAIWGAVDPPEKLGIRGTNVAVDWDICEGCGICLEVCRARVAFVPHVIVGLHYGKLKGEFHALKMISKYHPSALVIIAFMPIHGTEMEKVVPPEPIEIAEVIATARLMLPKTPLALGCMRPRGRHRIETDILALKAGVNAIAFPTEEAIAFAAKRRDEIAFSPLCCSQIFTEMKT